MLSFRPRSTLDEKYKRYRSQGFDVEEPIGRHRYEGRYTNRRDHYTTRPYTFGSDKIDVRFDDDIGISSERNDRKSLYSKPIRQGKLASSPIRTLQTSKYTPTKLRPPGLYKMLEADTPNGRGILVKKGNHRYNPKAVGSEANRKPGIFNKLRLFLTRFSLDNYERDQDYLMSLKQSAEDVLDIKKSNSGLKGGKRVLFGGRNTVHNSQVGNDLFATSTSDSATEHDPLVVSRLEAKIKEEQQRNEELKERYKRELEELELDHELRAQSLLKQIEELRQQELKGIDQSHIHRIQQLEDALSESRDILQQRERRELQLEREKQQLLQEKISLKQREKKLKLMHKAIENEKKTLLAQKHELEKRSLRIRELDHKRIKLVDEIRENSKQQIKLGGNFKSKEFMNDRDNLASQIDEKKHQLRSTKNAYVSFLHALMETVQELTKNGSHTSKQYLERLNNLLVSLNSTRTNANHKLKFHHTRIKLLQYMAYFDRLDLLVSHGDFNQIKYSYSLEKLQEIDSLLLRLQTIFVKSLTRKKIAINHATRYLENHSFEPQASPKASRNGPVGPDISVETIARLYEKKSRLLDESILGLQILLLLSELLAKLDRVFDTINDINHSNQA